MGIVAAIARVRAGAKSAGLEGALNKLGAELKSDAIPERFRDVAGRLAALLGSSNTNTAAPQPAVASLEVALAQHASMRATAPADAVCPFTGLRADEMNAQHHAAAALVEAPPAPVAPAAAASESVTAPLSEPSTADAAPSALAAETAPEAAPATETLTSSAQAALTDAPETSATPAAEAPPVARQRPAPNRGEKRKERLAGASSVENTSARSATRPAAKRPRSRADGSRKKT